MSSSDRRSFLVGLGAFCALPLLAACGYTPAYAPGGPAAGLRGKVRMADPKDRDAFDLVGELEDRLGRPDAPRYELTYSMAVSEAGSALTPDGVTGRYNVTGHIDYQLRDIATGAVLTKGSAQSFVSYGATGSTVATLSAQTDAHHRLAVILADEVVSRLLATSKSWHK